MEQKFTTMAQEAVGDAIQSASAAGNAQVETLHVMDALLRQENGVVRSLIEAAGGDPQAIGAAVRNALVALPSASGSSTSQPQASRQLTAAIAQAEKEMQQMGDEYVSTEHLLIGIAASKPNQSAEILEKNGVTAASLRKAVPGVRGGAKVTSPDAEELVQGPGEVLHRPDGRRQGRQARSGHRPRPGDPPRHPGPLPAHQEQPGADRRARRSASTCRRGRPGPAYRGGRRAHHPARQEAHLP